MAQDTVGVLQFPLPGLKPDTASIVSVVDHSLHDPYSRTNDVVAFTAEKGEKSIETGDCYANIFKKAFVLFDNYAGTRADGHISLL
ncbi:MAG: hypothetical protein DMG57_35750 [Acidobacteria bacterium]|nr:MAG: hypothetical protein DMG57_35750 [Acidobacteriota bacterium]